MAAIVYAGNPKYYGSLMYWLAAIAYTLQIYFDFSGYSDMAIGLGRMFGFHFLENFNYPYISFSVTEFWRRWHISLSTWFRDYVYIPLVRSLAADVSIVPPLLWMIPGLIFSAPIHQRVHLGDSWGAEVVRNTACLALLAICILFSVSATFNPFIYFRF